MRSLALILLSSALAGCSHPYVLHYRPPTKFYQILKPPKESAPIPSTASNVALFYDRAPYVVIDKGLPDGSAWVHYAVEFKNASPQVQSVDLKTIRIEGAGERGETIFDDV